MYAGAVRGGDSLHSSSISASTETTSFAWISRNARSARCFGPPNGTASPAATASSGPRRRKSTAADGKDCPDRNTLRRWTKGLGLTPKGSVPEGGLGVRPPDGGQTPAARPGFHSRQHPDPPGYRAVAAGLVSEAENDPATVQGREGTQLRSGRPQCRRR